MKYLVVLLCFTALATSFEFQKEWETWKLQYGKKYNDEKEEMAHHAIWKSNKLYVEEHNANADQWGYTLSMNIFADINRTEFAKTRQGFVPMTQGNYALYIPPNFSDEPASVDWRDKGYVTPVKNQGQCGSCWAFSATGSLEGQHFKKTGNLVSLSEQNLVDCSKNGNKGCDGGSMEAAFEYIKSNGGIDTEDSYPYKAEKGKCKFQSANVGATCTGYKKILTHDCFALRRAVANVGPISVGMDASHGSFQLYEKGIYDPKKCFSALDKLDHGVLVVGYGEEEGKEYWLVKNSWGKHWGMDGYFKIASHSNVCGICTDASYPTV